MSSAQPTMNPASFGGFGRGSGGRYPGGLRNIEFSSTCPPDVQPNTRIIAVCGVSDSKDLAAPDKDGWFFSDFFLFHHLLQNCYKFQAGNQIWLTCADPVILVQKYKEYLHCDRHGNRRVVLDASLIPSLNQAGNIRELPPTELLERFLSTLKQEIEIAAVQNQPVLVLVFGHGDEESHGVAIGGDSQANAPRLSMNQFKACLKKNVDTTLVITSCFSGGWVTKPDLATSIGPTPRPKFNITAMTAATAEAMSRSWAQSLSLGRRAAGSMFATAVMNALMDTSKNTPGFDHMCSAFDSVLKETEEGNAMADEPTYISLVEAVHTAFEHSFTGLGKENGISFAAKDDRWDFAWRKRTGFPLLNYQERFEQLRQAPVGMHVWAEHELIQMTGGVKRSLKFQNQVTREKAIAYMKSFPGPNNLGCNSIHAQFRGLIEGDDIDDEDMAYYDNVLEYRMSLLELATDFARFLDLDIAHAKSYNTSDWYQANLLQRQSKDLSVSAEGREQMARVREVNILISKKKLFGVPFRCQGPSYDKPKDYLAIALVSANLSKSEIETKIDKLHKLNNAKQYLLTKTPVAMTVIEDREVIRSRNTLRKTLGKFGQRLRSLSPSERSPAKSPSHA